MIATPGLAGITSPTPALKEFTLRLSRYGGDAVDASAHDVFIDDVVLSTTRFGCGD